VSRRLNLQGATLSGTLIDPFGNKVTLPEDVAKVVEPAQNGEVEIVLPASFTSTLQPGRYSDVLRVRVSAAGGEANLTVWAGQLLVGRNPSA
jgi:hypothetical protein